MASCARRGRRLTARGPGRYGATMTSISLWAVVAAAIVSFVFGAFLYSPALFLEAWSREAGVDPSRQIEQPVRVFGLTFVLTLANAFVLAVLLGAGVGFGTAAMAGFGVGACVAAASLGINYQFASRSARFWLIDGGFHTVRFTLMGVVLGLWPGA